MRFPPSVYLQDLQRVPHAMPEDYQIEPEESKLFGPAS